MSGVKREKHDDEELQNKKKRGGEDLDDGEDDDSDEDGKGGEKKTGRRKINIEFIEDKSRRHITFSKRKAGIMKKAYELSTLTGTQVLLLVASETGHVYTFATPKLQPLITKPEGKNLIQACLNSPDGVLPSEASPPRTQSSNYDQNNDPPEQAPEKTPNRAPQQPQAQQAQAPPHFPLGGPIGYPQYQVPMNLPIGIQPGYMGNLPAQYTYPTQPPAQYQNSQNFNGQPAAKKN